MKKGVFIVLDGGDGSGKATQTELLLQRLRNEGHAAEKVDFPKYDGNTFGALIGESLAGKHGDFLNLDPKIASSLYALDRFESSPKIRSLLDAGTIVIADRYASANQIHQGGKVHDPKEREDFMLWLEHVEFEILGIPRPDRTIYLRVPVATSLELLSEKRKAKIDGLADGQMDQVEEDRQYLENSVKTADWLLSREDSWSAVNCMGEQGIRSREDIHEDIWRIVESELT